MGSILINEFGRDIPQIDSLFRKISVTFTFVVAIALTTLTLALSRWMPSWLAAMACALCLCGGNLPSPSYIHPDSFACSIVICFVATALFLFYQPRLYKLFLLCLCAVYGMAVKPGLAFLSLLAGVVCAYFFIIFLYRKKIGKLVSTICIGLFLIIGTTFWSILIFIQSGFFVPSQMSGASNMLRAIYLMKNGDEELFHNEFHKKIVIETIKEKNTKEVLFFARTDASKISQARAYMSLMNIYGWRHMNDVLQKFGIKLNAMEFNKLVKQIEPIIIHAHRKEFNKLVWNMFTSFISRYDDFHVSFLQNSKFIRDIFKNNIFWLHIFLYIFIVASIFTADNKYKLILLFITSIHPISMALHAVGFGVHMRYAAYTDWTLIVALALAAYSLYLRIPIHIHTNIGGVNV